MKKPSSQIDAGEHLPLINRVIGQMGITGSDAEEAFSEGLVAITEAARTYNPEKNVSIASWLAKNIRWSIHDMRAKQRHTVPLIMPIEATRDILNSHMDLKEALLKLEEILSPVEKQIILAGAFGYTGEEISRALGLYPVAVSRAKKRAQQKLKELR